jgi:nanoRNase/pAp phosphatase (c-di-AMP/oligoRNAs hydrolase)
MQKPFPKSVSTVEKLKRLYEVIEKDDYLAILINADPDALASAMALSRLFWRKSGQVDIFRINRIDRADNLAFLKLLNIPHRHVRALKKSEVDKWALVDSQPSHNAQFGKYEYDIIIDHHPVTDDLNAEFIDIKEDYGATSTMLTEYLKAAKIRPSSRLATALFYGIKSDTDNFLRRTVANDVNAFRHLYEFTNINIVKKIESSELTQKTLAYLRTAMQQLMLVKETAYIHMKTIDNPDLLVIVADFFMKLAEATWCVVSGVYKDTLIVIFRNAGFRKDAGKLAEEMFGDIGSAGGHQAAARAEIPLNRIPPNKPSSTDYGEFVLSKIKKMKTSFA